MAASTFAFVPTGNDGKPRPSHRHIVRHVAMKGRNLRVGVRPVVPPITLAELTASDNPKQEHTRSSHSKRRRRDHPVLDRETLGCTGVSPTFPIPLAAELDSVSYQALHTGMSSLGAASESLRWGVGTTSNADQQSCNPRQTPGIHTISV